MYISRFRLCVLSCPVLFCCVFSSFCLADLLKLVGLRGEGRAECVHDLVVLAFHRHPSGALKTPWQANRRGGGGAKQYDALYSE